MPVSVATQAELAALSLRVAALEAKAVVPPIVVPPPTPSKAWTEIPRDGPTLVLPDHSTISLLGGVVMRDTGVGRFALGANGSAVLITVDTAGLVYHQSTGTNPGWWVTDVAKNPTVWAAAADPRPSTLPPVVVTPPVAGSPRARLMAYLQGLAGHRCLFGQTTHPGPSPASEFNAITQAFGFSPAIMFFDPWLDQWAGNAPFNAACLPLALAHAKSGGIVGMSLMLPNPVDHGPSQGGPAVDPVQLLTAGTALNASLNGLLDQAAGLLAQFRTAGNAVLTRFLLELDGGWFWWGDGHMTNAQQTALFRYIVNYLRVTKGLDNLLTTFAINGGPGDFEYPGDDVVDILGIDCYTDNLTGYKGTYDKLRAAAPSKLFALTEDGSGDPNGPDPSFDQTRLKADIQSTMPLAVYANFWSGWGPDRNTNGRAAMSDPFWINKAQVTGV